MQESIVNKHGSGDQNHTSPPLNLCAFGALENSPKDPLLAKGLPTYDELKSLFEYSVGQRYRGVPGVIRIDSGAPGPTAAISLFTHGNEPSGLAVLWRALQDDILAKRLERGSVLFVLNNIEAAGRSFSLSTPEERRRARFIDINMNRLPKNALELTTDSRSELRRLRELYPIYREIDVALDVHSTSQESDPMVIEITNMDRGLTKGFGIDKVLVNIVPIQVGIPIGCFFGGIDREITVFEIEAGSHENPNSFGCAIDSAFKFLANLNMIKLESPAGPREISEYRIASSVLFPNDTYQLVKVFRDFEAITQGQVLAAGDGEPILSPIDGHTLFGTPNRKPASIAEEALFLSEAAQRIQI